MRLSISNALGTAHATAYRGLVLAAAYRLVLALAVLGPFES